MAELTPQQLADCPQRPNQPLPMARSSTARMMGALRLSQPHTHGQTMWRCGRRASWTCPIAGRSNIRPGTFLCTTPYLGVALSRLGSRICTSKLESSRKLFQARQICQLGGRGCSTDAAETALPRQVSHTELVGPPNRSSQCTPLSITLETANNRMARS